jgi:hypothetical protein
MKIIGLVDEGEWLNLWTNLLQSSLCPAIAKRGGDDMKGYTTHDYNVL